MNNFFKQHLGFAALLLGALFIGFASSTLAAPSAIQPSAMAQISVLQRIKTSRTKVQQKLDSRLILAIMHQRNDPSISTLTDFRFVQPEADGLVAVDIGLYSVAGIKQTVDYLETLDAKILGMNYPYQTIRARVRLEDLESIAGLDAVRNVRKAVPAMTHKIDTSQGDKTHGADLARGFFGTNGLGVKVCVLSDGVDSLATLQGSGDLPPFVDVLPGQAGGGDEGSAMLEIIHDLAPGAALGFATGFDSEASFAQNILDLAAAGCNIIVDDIIYFDESAFQDGPVAQAVNTVTAAGVLFFSSAGNEGNLDDGTSGAWEGDFNPNGTPTALAGGGPAHNFGDGGQSILVTANGVNAVLTWAENYDGAAGTGDASTDFDLYRMDGGLTTIFDASTDAQNGVGGDDLAVEISGFTLSGERLVVLQLAAGTTSSVPMFNLINFRGELDPALATSGATRGHSAAKDAYSVAATPAGASFDGISLDGPFPGLFTSVNQSENFTSDGPRRIILSPLGVELCPDNRTSTCSADLRPDPDITAADGVSTAAPGFDPFYGTSASAPHAAAIAALIKSAVPGITPVDIRTALIASAIDIETAGVDRDTGAGIVMAQAAIQAAGGVPQAFLDSGTPIFSELAGDGDVFIESNEEWKITVPLQNIGGAGATAISAALSTPTANVFLINSNSSYADLAPSASANNAMDYAFHVGAGFLCAKSIDFTLQATYPGGPLSPQDFGFASDSTGSTGTPVAFSYTGSPVAIPDAADLSGTNPGAAVQAPVSSPSITGNLKDIDLSIDGAICTNTAGAATVGIDHSWVNDLEITLISPLGTLVKVINHTDGGGNNFCQTLLDDESAGPSIQSVATADAPFTGSFTPNASLSGFDGEDPNGTWNFQAQDFFSFDTGNIRDFTITVTPGVCDAPPLTVDVQANMLVSGNFMPGGTVIYTVMLTNYGTGSALDNPGDEFTDVLPAQLTLVSSTATSGTVVPAVNNLALSESGENPIVPAATNTVTWNGSIPPATTVTITINATVNSVPAGQTISNQGSGSFDTNYDGSNDAVYLTDQTPGNGTIDPTEFIALTGTIIAPVPTITQWGFLLLVLVLATAGVGASRGNSAKRPDI